MMKHIITILIGANLAYLMAVYHKPAPQPQRCYTLSTSEETAVWRMTKLIHGDNYHPAMEAPPRKPEGLNK